MPRLTEANVRLNMHIFGYPKVRKTMWAESAAEAGFNVLILDGDGGYSVGVNTLSAEAKERLYALNLQDKSDDFIFSKSVFQMFKSKKPTFIDEKTQTFSAIKLQATNLQVDLSKATLNDVVILDSYSALVQSLYHYHAKETNTLDKLVKTTWDDFKYAQDWSGQLFTAMKALPCHFILINHAGIANVKQGGGEKQERLSPIGTSSNQAATISRYFNEMLYFGALNEHTTQISTGGRSDRDGGSRMIAPSNHTYFGPKMPETVKNGKNFDFKAFCDLAGIKTPKDAAPSEAWKEI